MYEWLKYDIIVELEKNKLEEYNNFEVNVINYQDSKHPNY